MEPAWGLSSRLGGAWKELGALCRLLLLSQGHALLEIGDGGEEAESNLEHFSGCADVTSPGPRAGTPPLLGSGR